ncbi:hypothetical protein C9J85_19490 [Haloferax sp. wsp5]|nr:hypothetical protein C9J85_19490 [Haloferax sp. wsp5]
MSTAQDELDDAVADDVVLVDFYADWCGPCKQLEPAVERIAAGTAATVAKVDIDANQQLAAKYGVRSVPTLLLFVDGEPVERLVGCTGTATPVAHRELHLILSAVSSQFATALESHLVYWWIHVSIASGRSLTGLDFSQYGF